MSLVAPRRLTRFIGLRDTPTQQLADDLRRTFVITHRMGLHDAATGYETFKNKQDECVKAVLRTDAGSEEAA